MSTLSNYNFESIKPYVIYLEDTVPYDPGIFYTFETEKELLEVLKSELLVFGGVEESNLEQFQEDLEAALPESINDFDESVLDRINVLIPLWNVGFVGTFEDLLSSNKEAPKWFRKEFREYADIEGGDSPLNSDEIDSFKTFMLPEWER